MAENPVQFVVDLLGGNAANRPDSADLPPRPTTAEIMLAAFNPAAQAAAQAPPPPPPPPPAPTLSATLLYSRVSKNILCMEAGKELVDIVVGFLTLPLGCVVKLLQAIEPPAVEGAAAPVLSSKREVKPLVGITSLFNCADRIEESWLCSSKGLLVDPRPTMSFGGKIIMIPGTEGSALYCCGAPAACEFISKNRDLKCPKHKKKMENPVKVLASEEDVTAAAAAAAAGGKGKEEAEAPKKGKKGAAPVAEVVLPPGYIKAGASFMITNTLEVFPSSTIQSILRLGTQKGEKMSDLESMDITVSGEEIVHMLKSSLSSTNVLNDVFGKHCKKPLSTQAMALPA